MMGWPSTITGVAQAYEDFLDVLVVDHADKAAAEAMGGSELRVLCSNTIMTTNDSKRDLAAFLLEVGTAPQSTKA
jgi:hypothetical protein